MRPTQGSAAHVCISLRAQVSDGFAGAAMPAQPSVSLRAAPPGSPGRFLLPPDAAGSAELNTATFVIRLSVALDQTYIALQGLLLLALVGFYFAELAHLPRIAIIVESLTGSLGPMGEFLLVAVPLLVCLAVVGCAAGGAPRIALPSSLPGGMDGASCVARHVRRLRPRDAQPLLRARASVNHAYGRAPAGERSATLSTFWTSLVQHCKCAARWLCRACRRRRCAAHGACASI